MKATCSSCGEAITANKKFCGHCGAAQQAPAEKLPKSSSKSNKVVILIGATVGAFLLCGIYFFSSVIPNAIVASPRALPTTSSEQVHENSVNIKLMHCPVDELRALDPYWTEVKYESELQDDNTSLGCWFFFDASDVFFRLRLSPGDALTWSDSVSFAIREGYEQTTISDPEAEVYRFGSFSEIAGTTVYDYLIHWKGLIVETSFNDPDIMLDLLRPQM